jgi:Uma2 family endonuclease
MGWQEAYLAVRIATILNNFVGPRKLGLVLGADGMIRLKPEQVRLPDVAFISQERFAGRPLRPTACWELGFDLAVEVISPSNTRREMERKLSDYFASGVRLVWFVYPISREIAVHTSPQDVTMLHVGDTLEGGAVMPGFSVPVAQLFAELDATQPPA